MAERKKQTAARRRRRRKTQPVWLWQKDLALAVVAAIVGGVGVWTLLRPQTLYRVVEVARGRPNPLQASPADYAWTQPPEVDFAIPPYARFLKGVKIVLDPGHVGQKDPGGGWKRGPTGLREAEVNLRVAQALREFLQTTGADVTLTRDVDKPGRQSDGEDLRSRAAVANRVRADLFLSIHHNAAGDPQANHSLVFYHGEFDNGPASLAAGRHLLTGLQDALRLPKHVECPLMSDRAQDTNGFAVLRQADGPAVLTEASFFSSPAEEQRLRDPVYTRREAYGLFLGLARWAQAGLPRVSLAGDARVDAGEAIIVRLDDGLSGRGGWGAEALRILPDTIVVRVGGQPAPYSLDEGKRQLRITAPGGKRGRQKLYVNFENIFGQAVGWPVLEVDVR